MWVEQTKQGKYKYIERYKCPLTGKYKRASVVLEKNTRQAQKQAQEALTLKIQRFYEHTEEGSHASGTYVPAGCYFYTHF